MPFITVDTCSAHLKDGGIINAPHFEEFSDQPPSGSIIWVKDALATSSERCLLGIITEDIFENLQVVNESWGCSVVKPELMDWTERNGLKMRVLFIWFLKPELGFELLSQVWSAVESALARHDHEEGTNFTPEMFALQTPG